MAWWPVVGYTTIFAGSLGAWTVGGTSLDLIEDAYGAITNVSVDLAGTPGPGVLSQGFTAMIGSVYTLTFDYANNGGSVLNVSLGSTAMSFSPIVPGTSTLTWTATSTAGMVSFNSGTAIVNGGPVIDNVVLTVTPVPEPTTVAMLLAGLGALGFMGGRRRSRG